MKNIDVVKEVYGTENQIQCDDESEVSLGNVYYFNGEILICGIRTTVQRPVQRNTPDNYRRGASQQHVVKMRNVDCLSFAALEVSSGKVLDKTDFRDQSRGMGGGQTDSIVSVSGDDPSCFFIVQKGGYRIVRVSRNDLVGGGFGRGRNKQGERREQTWSYELQTWDGRRLGGVSISNRHLSKQQPQTVLALSSKCCLVISILDPSSKESPSIKVFTSSIGRSGIRQIPKFAHMLENISKRNNILGPFKKVSNVEVIFPINSCFLCLFNVQRDELVRNFSLPQFVTFFVLSPQSRRGSNRIFLIGGERDSTHRSSGRLDFFSKMSSRPQNYNGKVYSVDTQNGQVIAKWKNVCFRSKKYPNFMYPANPKEVLVIYPNYTQLLHEEFGTSEVFNDYLLEIYQQFSFDQNFELINVKRGGAELSLVKKVKGGYEVKTLKFDSVLDECRRSLKKSTTKRGNEVDTKKFEVLEEFNKKMSISNNELKRKIDLQQQQIEKLKKQNIKMNKQLSTLQAEKEKEKRKVVVFQRKLNDHVDEYHREKLSITKQMISPQMNKKEENKYYCFENEVYTYQFEFSVISDQNTSQKIDFSPLQVTMSGKPLRNIKCVDNSIEFGVKYPQLGLHELKILFRNINKVILIDVESSEICSSKCELSLFRGEIQPNGDIMRSSQPTNKFSSKDPIQIVFRVCNENGVPLKKKYCEELYLTAKICEEGKRRGMKGVLSSTGKVLEVDLEDFEFNENGEVLICTIGEDKLDPGKYDFHLGEAEFGNVKKTFLVLE